MCTLLIDNQPTLIAYTGKMDGIMNFGILPVITRKLSKKKVAVKKTEVPSKKIAKIVISYEVQYDDLDSQLKSRPAKTAYQKYWGRNLDGNYGTRTQHLNGMKGGLYYKRNSHGFHGRKPEYKEHTSSKFRVKHTHEGPPGIRRNFFED